MPREDRLQAEDNSQVDFADKIAAIARATPRGE